MLKKLMSLVISGLLAGSLMVGCSSSNTNNKTESSIKEEKHMTEEERIATLKGLERAIFFGTNSPNTSVK